MSTFSSADLNYSVLERNKLIGVLLSIHHDSYCYSTNLNGGGGFSTSFLVLFKTISRGTYRRQGPSPISCWQTHERSPTQRRGCMLACTGGYGGAGVVCGLGHHARNRSPFQHWIPLRSPIRIY